MRRCLSSTLATASMTAIALMTAAHAGPVAPSYGHPGAGGYHPTSPSHPISGGYNFHPQQTVTIPGAVNGNASMSGGLGGSSRPFQPHVSGGNGNFGSGNGNGSNSMSGGLNGYRPLQLPPPITTGNGVANGNGHFGSGYGHHDGGSSIGGGLGDSRPFQLSQPISAMSVGATDHAKASGTFAPHLFHEHFREDTSEYRDHRRWSAPELDHDKSHDGHFAYGNNPANGNNWPNASPGGYQPFQLHQPVSGVSAGAGHANAPEPIAPHMFHDGLHEDTWEHREHHRQWAPERGYDYSRDLHFGDGNGPRNGSTSIGASSGSNPPFQLGQLVTAVSTGNGNGNGDGNIGSYNGDFNGDTFMFGSSGRRQLSLPVTRASVGNGNGNGNGNIGSYNGDFNGDTFIFASSGRHQSSQLPLPMTTVSAGNGNGNGNGNVGFGNGDFNGDTFILGASARNQPFQTALLSTTVSAGNGNGNGNGNVGFGNGDFNGDTFIFEASGHYRPFQLLTLLSTAINNFFNGNSTVRFGNGAFNGDTFIMTPSSFFELL